MKIAKALGKRRILGNEELDGQRPRQTERDFSARYAEAQAGGARVFAYRDTRRSRDRMSESVRRAERDDSAGGVRDPARYQQQHGRGRRMAPYFEEDSRLRHRRLRNARGGEFSRR